jgi:hypothetical protein
MKDKQHLLKQIAVLEREVKTLRTQIDKIDNEPKLDFWRPKDDDESWRIFGNLKVRYNSREEYVDVGNCFPTQETAEREARYLRAYYRLRAIARKLNGDWTPCVDDDNSRVYFLTYEVEDKEFIINYFDIWVPTGLVLFKSRETALRALDWLTTADQDALRDGGYR